MEQPDSSQNQESQQITCAGEALVDKLSSEQLRKWLNDRRNGLKKERLTLLGAADRLKKEIAAVDQMLADLKT